MSQYHILRFFLLQILPSSKLENLNMKIVSNVRI